MDSLVQDRIYKKVAVYDYQGACSNSKYPFSGKGTRLQPPGSINFVFKFVLQALFLLISKLETVYATALAYSQEEGKILIIVKKIYLLLYFKTVDEINYDYEYTSGDELGEQHPVQPPPVDFVPPFESDPLEGVDLGQWGTRPCDRKVELYALQPERLNTSGQNNPLKGKLTNCHVTGCER